MHCKLQTCLQTTAVRWDNLAWMTRTAKQSQVQLMPACLCAPAAHDSCAESLIPNTHTRCKYRISLLLLWQHNQLAFCCDLGRRYSTWPA